MSVHVTDRSIERGVSELLRTGVVVSGLSVLAGGVFYLAKHGWDPVTYGTFRGQPETLRKLGGIVAGAFQREPRAIMQAGILLLIATPILRVAISLVGFAIEKDWR
jgi:uncharacterized membrane protein